MRFIDFHTHIYPEAIAQKAAQSICDFYELDGGGMNGTVESLLQQGAEAGIAHYVVLPVGLKFWNRPPCILSLQASVRFMREWKT